jgi:nucleoside-diphosphate-sugar epimerase
VATVLILGAGYTAARVARRFVDAGADVVITNRRRIELAGARSLAMDVTDIAGLRGLEPLVSEGATILHSIPQLAGTAELVAMLRPLRPARMVYLSTTGVYGAAESVDERTLPNPETEKDHDRMETERRLADGPWSTLVLRPAAIYGPGRGVHWSIRQRPPRPIPSGNRIVSRIHVDDVAEHAVKAMQSDVSGAFPVADEEPCPSSDVAQWTCAYLGIPFLADETEAQMRGRRVDGSAIRRLLGVELRYRSFREGVVACIEEEAAEPISFPTASRY